jgi:SSS family solute:Na+ symporter
MNPYYFFSYTFIPLSAIAFPHMAIFCLTARKMESFKRTVVFYPLCLLAIWLPSVFLGTVAASDPQVRAAIGSPAASDEVIPLLLRLHAPSWLAGVLGAGIMAAVMAADSQILALSTMFTEDVFAYYGGKRAFGERVQVLTGRAFVVGVTVVAYAIAMTTSEGIFNLAVKYAFTGFAALSPLIIAALFWKRSTKWGALASVLVVAAGLIAIAWLEGAYPPEVRPYDLWGGILTRTPGGIAVWKGFLPVLPLVLLSALAMVAGSLATRPPSRGTIERYFPGPRRSEAVPALPAWARG